jgi:hypothetical protein
MFYVLAATQFIAAKRRSTSDLFALFTAAAFRKALRNLQASSYGMLKSLHTSKC